MWSPTHIQVTVQRAKDLLTKGKNGTNNCFVTIALGKEKYQTSVKEKAETSVSWNEECELKIPDQGNRAELILTCLHRNNLGIDEFLGQATLPLNEMDVYDRPRSKWFKLQSKPGKEKKNKERGELEVRISFIVKSGSLTDLSKKEKHKSSVGQLASSVGGSLLSIGTIEKRKSIKKFAKSLGSKMHLHSKKKPKDGDDLSFNGSFASIDTTNSLQGGNQRYGQRAGEADPGVISEDEDEFVFDNLSHKSSGSSLNVRSNGGLQVPQKNFAPRNPSPLLTVADNLAYKGNDIMEEPEHFLEYEREQTHTTTASEEQKEQFQEIAKLPPPSSERKLSLKSDTINDWDLKPYTQQTESLKRNTLSAAPADELTNDSITQPASRKSDTLAASVELRPKETLPSDVENNLVDVDKLKSENDRNSVPLVADKSKDSAKKKQKIDEWESKLYLDINKSDSLKRNTWQTARVQLPSVDAESPKTESQRFSLLFENDKNAQAANGDRDAHAHALDVSDSEDSDVSAADDDIAPIQQPSSDAKNFQINQSFIENESKPEQSMPQPSPRNYPKIAEKTRTDDNIKLNLSYESRKQERENLLDNIKMNLGYENKQLRAQNSIISEETVLDEDAHKAKVQERNEEDRRILNFINDAKMREAMNDSEQSPVLSAERREKRFGKLRNFNEGGKQSSPRSNERIIIGHEKSMSHAERRSEMTEALAKKYEGKSREELMLIANGMENEVLIYRQRVKELEDYLDNLLLRVMETHPKILQNPYSRTNSTKSG